MTDEDAISRPFVIGGERERGHHLFQGSADRGAHSRWLLAAGELHGLMLDMVTRHVVYALDLLRVVYKIRAGLERRPYQSQEVSKHNQHT